MKTERGTIVIDGLVRAPTCRASTPSATSPARRMLAHKAEHEGVICVEAIKGLHPHPMDKLHDPRLHLLHAADRLGRAHRSKPPRTRSSTSASAASPSSATARRSRSARTRAWSR